MRCDRHVDPNPLVGANAHGNIVGAASSAKAGALRVGPGDPYHSYVRIIRRWIEQGALND
jgi:hypothetical protein